MGSECAALRVWLATVLVTVAVFGLWPQVDLAVSGLFHDAAAGFWLADNRVVEGLRHRLWDATTALCLIAAAGLVMAQATRRPALWMPGRVWAFVLALYVAGPGIVVNGLLKAHWGRARPADIVAFGGDRLFTPPFLPADQCARNCSFVSGEAAAAMALGIAAYVMLRHLRPRLSPRLWRAGMAVAVAIPLTGAALRIVAGRHFLSDTVCAALIVAGIALALHRLILRGKPLAWPRFRPTPRPENRAHGRPDPVLTSPATPPIRRDT